MFATVQDLIDHLQKNFNPNSKLCFWGEFGSYMNCEHILKEHLGDRFFISVKKDKKDLKECYPDENWDNEYKNVDDEDVIIS